MEDAQSALALLTGNKEGSKGKTSITSAPDPRGQPSVWYCCAYIILSLLNDS